MITKAVRANFQDPDLQNFAKRTSLDLNDLKVSKAAQSDMAQAQTNILALKDEARIIGGWPNIGGSASFVANRLYASRFLVPSDCKSRGAIIPVISSANGNMLVGLYSNSSGNPGSLVASAPELALVATTDDDRQKKVLWSPECDISAGEYWMVILLDTAQTLAVAVNSSVNGKYLARTYSLGLPESFGTPTGNAATFAHMAF